MMTVEPIMLEGHPFTAISVQLPKTNLLVVTNKVGYIMCGALDIALLNEKLGNRNIVAGRAVGVRTIEELLKAPLESVTVGAHHVGWTIGMSGEEALLKLVE
ncbi:YunC family protein [Pontibacillus litoralis]|uniref:DUF1805 domain-containing protein n=1 Tax=Pontibacillus litoralis JSM 072002 TaxID=1385512 RepID=A0A0A5G3S0_9BACI|nr:DUF1805 domain-containing protein [Pontibacillus litoralis]KGX86689.1 hypothetical protein N784_03580 [Pontibacillus litoralis JSM 072002]